MVSFRIPLFIAFIPLIQRKTQQIMVTSLSPTMHAVTNAWTHGILWLYKSKRKAMTQGRAKRQGRGENTIGRTKTRTGGLGTGTGRTGETNKKPRKNRDNRGDKTKDTDRTKREQHRNANRGHGKKGKQRENQKKRKNHRENKTHTHTKKQTRKKSEKTERTNTRGRQRRAEGKNINRRKHRDQPARLRHYLRPFVSVSSKFCSSLCMQNLDCCSNWFLKFFFIFKYIKIIFF